MNEFLPALINALIPIVGLLFTALVAYAAKVATTRMKSGAAKDAALELIAASEMVVRSVAQEVRPRLEAAAADGKLSKEDFANLKATAVKQLEDQLSEQTLALIESNSKRLEDVLSRAVESSVNKLKSEPAAILRSTPIAGELEEITAR